MLSLVSTICLDQESGFVAKVGAIREMCPSLLEPSVSVYTIAWKKTSRIVILVVERIHNRIKNDRIQ